MSTYFIGGAWEACQTFEIRSALRTKCSGIALATGSIIAFIDANCIPADGWVDAIARDIREGKDIVCGPVLDAGEGNLVHYAPEHAEARYVEVCTTISVGIRRTVIETIGVFDPTFSFGQDVDFFWRARDAGFRIYYDPAVSIQHHWGDRQEQLERAFQYGKARAHLYKKHWLKRWRQLAREHDGWTYALFIACLPLTFFLHWYPLLLLIPIIKNITHNPVGLVVHHLAYGLGMITGILKRWQREPASPQPLRAPLSTPTL